MERYEVVIECCGHDEDEVKEFQEEMKNKFNIKAEFYDGGDHYSHWNLTGDKLSLKKAIIEHWGDDLEDIVYCMYEDEFKMIFDEKASKYLD